MAEREIKLGTVAPSVHFPNQNQAKHCYTAYTAFWRCVRDNGGDEDADVCQKFRTVYTSLCPNKWKSDWDEQRAAGTFPTPYRD